MRIGPLSTQAKPYGVDYYWREEWVMVSGKWYIGFTIGCGIRYAVILGIPWLAGHWKYYPQWRLHGQVFAIWNLTALAEEIKKVRND